MFIETKSSGYSHTCSLESTVGKPNRNLTRYGLKTNQLAMAPLQPSSSMAATSTESSSVLKNECGDVEGGILKPEVNDVLCGRGGSINTHPGNEKFRKLIEKNKRVYLTARFKKDKRLITDSVIEDISSRGGRFLNKDTKSGLWFEVSEEKARDKTSQALRENAPKYREAIERENIAVRKAMELEEEAAKRAHKAQVQQYYGKAPHNNPHFNNEYHNDLNHQVSPIKQQHQSFDHNREYAPGWGDNPGHIFRHNSPIDHTPPRSTRTHVIDETPRYNNTKSFMESFSEAFMCPTSLDDIYSKTKPYLPSSHQSRIESDMSSQYSGHKRSYQPSQSYSQGRDDREYWGSQNHYDKSNSPVYYHLPTDENRNHPASPYNAPRHPKRKKGPRDDVPVYNAQSTTQSSGYSDNHTPWNFFPLPWNAPSSTKPQITPNPTDEGQEVQLISRVESMTMDCPHNLHEYEDQTCHDRKGTPEVRTPPPGDDRNQPDNGDWFATAGDCNFLTDMLGLNIPVEQKNTDANLGQDEKDDYRNISPVPSIDMNGSMGSLGRDTDGHNSSTDLNGASLVNVFSEGENTEKSAKSSSPSFNISLGDSLLTENMSF